MTEKKKERKNRAEAMTQEGEKITEENEVCDGCEKELVEEGRLVECEICQKWFCNKCHGIDEELKVSVKGIHWVCKNCDDVMVKLIEGQKTKNLVNTII